MTYILLFCIAGLIVGYRLRRLRGLRHVERTLTLTIRLLLLLLGFSVGADARLMSCLPSLGGQALLFGGLASVGSALGAAVLWHCLRRSGERKGEAER